MTKINQIINHPTYKAQLQAIKAAEAERIFCGHDMNHFLDVARIGYIYVLEGGLPYSKELVYAFALLHDIGRGRQYQDGTPHDSAGVALAEEILTDIHYEEKDKGLILRAIAHHRGHEGGAHDGFAALMQKADKASRACYRCSAERDCYWAASKKNWKIEV